MKKRGQFRSIENGEPIIVFLVMFLLSIHHLVQRLSQGEVLGIDGNAMQIALHADCSLPNQLANITFTPIYKCTYELLSHVFAVPPLYLFVTIGLKFFTLFGLYLIYRNLASRFDPAPVNSIIGIFCLSFLIIGGLGRLQLNGDLILKSGIYTGMWAQMFLVYTIYWFISRRYLLAGALMGLSILLHPANAIHVFAVLLASLVLITSKGALVRALVLFGSPALVAVMTQYVAAYGWPSSMISSLNGMVFEPKTTPIPDYSVSEWYEYVRSQDPDDLSLIWNLSTPAGLFYCMFAFIGFYIARKIENVKTLLEFVSRPAIAICIGWYLYVIGCILIEHFQYPEFLLKPLVVIQPRRAFYLPIIFLSFYVVKWLLDLLLSTRPVSLWRVNERILFCIWFYVFLLYSGNNNNASSTLITGLFLMSILIIGVAYAFDRQQYLRPRESIARAIKNPLLLGVGCILIVLLRMSTFTTLTAYENLKVTFFDAGPRSYTDYLIVQANAQDNGQAATDFLTLIEWVDRHIPRLDPILSAGLLEGDVMKLEVLLGRSIQSMNVYRYRGKMHFDKKAFDKIINYHSELLGVPITSMGVAGSHGTIIDGLKDIVLAFNENDFCQRSTKGGEPFKYFLTTYNLSLEFLVAFKKGSYTVYRLTEPGATGESCRT